MVRNFIRSMGFDVIRHPSRALSDAMTRIATLEQDNQRLNAMNSLLQDEISRGKSDLEAAEGQYDYNEDCLKVVSKNTDFFRQPRFAESYEKGMQSGHKIGRPKGSNIDIGIRWRVYTCCWAASHGAKLEGDFVECGVNTGIMSLSICNYINFNSLEKNFYLFDTFCGIPEEQSTAEELNYVRDHNTDFYEECYDVAVRNFAPYPKAHLVRGKVPETLSAVNIDKVCYLHIDMNNAYPEQAAINHFWEKLSPSAVVVLDDYGWKLFEAQRKAMDEFASQKGVEIYTVPTGQGILIKR